MPMPTPETVADYLAAQPPAARTLLRQVRAAIRKAVPRLEESVTYRIPTYKLDGRVVLYFAGFKDHYSVYPATAGLIAALGPQLAAHRSGKGTLRFEFGHRVPTALIGRIARIRAAEAAGKSAARKPAGNGTPGRRVKKKTA
ncbi:MAG: iron chaperone [Gemmatimonadales bacterium]